MTDNKRTFKIKSQDGTFTSRITGATPKQAALKALSIINNAYKNDESRYEVTTPPQKGGGNPVFKFSIKETTRLSNHKEYVYTGTRKLLETPASYVIKTADGVSKTITNHYKNIVSKFKE